MVAYSVSDFCCAIASEDEEESADEDDKGEYRLLIFVVVLNYADT